MDMFSLPLPNSGQSGTTNIDTPGPIVVVGANGSGKSRLGAWIEEILIDDDRPVLRVSAQKSLQLPENISLSAPESALKKWTYGPSYSQNIERQGVTPAYIREARLKGRWGKHPVTGFLNDYSALLEFLLAEHATEILEHNDQVEAASKFLPSPATRMKRLKRIWEQLLPGRTLLIGTGNVRTQPTGGSAYNSAEMSDGERVVFYLIASCLSAAPSAVLLVDEPELHLHRLVQRRLWDLIESERSDCLFVYFTHDLEFAASRATATQIALEGFDGTTWRWTYVPQDTELPETLLLSILGARKPVLFIEGDASSVDVEIYSRVYPDHEVVPVGSCADVIHSTTSFSNHKHLHQVTSKGLIDLDQRNAEECAFLLDRGVYTTGVSEAENLLMLESVMRLVAQLLHRDDVDQLIQRVKDDVLDFLARDRDRIVIAMLNAHLEDRLTKLRGGGKSEDEIAKGLSVLSDNVRAIAAGFRASLDKTSENRDYSAALVLYPNKGLSSLASKHFGLKSYKDDALRLLARPAGSPIVEAFRAALPVL